MRENIANALKEALKAKDQVALSTMRLIAAALKDRDIAARGNDNPDGISDDDDSQRVCKARTRKDVSSC